jgi:hypothetical protein
MTIDLSPSWVFPHQSPPGIPVTIEVHKRPLSGKLRYLAKQLADGTDPATVQQALESIASELEMRNAHQT